MNPAFLSLSKFAESGDSYFRYGGSLPYPKDPIVTYEGITYEGIASRNVSMTSIPNWLTLTNPNNASTFPPFYSYYDYNGNTTETSINLTGTSLDPNYHSIVWETPTEPYLSFSEEEEKSYRSDWIIDPKFFDDLASLEIKFPNSSTLVIPKQLLFEAQKYLSLATWSQTYYRATATPPADLLEIAEHRDNPSLIKKVIDKFGLFLAAYLLNKYYGKLSRALPDNPRVARRIDLRGEIFDDALDHLSDIKEEVAHNQIRPWMIIIAILMVATVTGVAADYGVEQLLKIWNSKDLIYSSGE